MFECLPIGSGTVRRCVFVGEAITLLEEVCHCGAIFEVSYAQTISSVEHSSLPVDQDVELLAPSPAPCLPASYHASHHEDNGVNL